MRWASSSLWWYFSCYFFCRCSAKQHYIGYYATFFAAHFFFSSLISLIADGPHHYHPACCGHGLRLTIFLSQCKFSTLLTTRQPMVEFYLLTFPRFPLRKKEHKSFFGNNRTHDFHTSRCAGYLLDRPLGRRVQCASYRVHYYYYCSVGFPPHQFDLAGCDHTLSTFHIPPARWLVNIKSAKYIYNNVPLLLGRNPHKFIFKFMTLKS